MTDAELLQQCHTVLPGHRALPGTSVAELYVGDNLTDMPDQQARAAVGLLATALAAAS